MGEGHGSLDDSKLRIQLVQHPNFLEKVDVIVVEFANPVHQSTIDRYVSGEDVSPEELRRVWRDTGYQAWESPIYEAFFEAVRDVNARNPVEARVRVLAGDVPVDWTRISSLEDYLREMAPYMTGPYIDRGSFPAKIIASQVLSKGLTALAVYGAGHCERGGTGFVHELEEEFPGQVFAIAPVFGGQAGANLRKALRLDGDPALVITRSPLIAARHAADFLVPGNRRSTTTISEAMDALVYYGSAPNVIVPRDPARGMSPAEVKEHQRRSQILREWGDWVERQIR